MSSLSCIIPTYKEASRIRSVLRAVHQHPLIDEIIVVDDGSRDGTENIVREFSDVRLITHEHNRGKSRAVVTGVRASRNDLLFFLDADLIGLTPGAISALIEPVVSGRADMSISLRINAPWLFRLIGLDYISGERVFPKKLISEHLDVIGMLPGYGLESYMNKLIVKNHYRIAVVRLNQVRSPWPQEKWGYFGGTYAFIRMLINILKTISIFEICYLTYKMYSARV